MKICMNTSQRGSADGVVTTTYEKGVLYELAESPRARDLARLFVSEGWAYEVRPQAPTEAPPPPEVEVPPAAPQLETTRAPDAPSASRPHHAPEAHTAKKGRH